MITTSSWLGLRNGSWLTKRQQGEEISPYIRNAQKERTSTESQNGTQTSNQGKQLSLEDYSLAELPLTSEALKFRRHPKLPKAQSIDEVSPCLSLLKILKRIYDLLLCCT